MAAADANVRQEVDQYLRSLRPRTMLLRGALLLVLIAAAVVAVELLVPGASRRLASADPAWLAVAVALEAGALISYVAFFHGVFGRAPEGLRLLRSAEVALGELAGFALVPTGAGGPAVRFWALRASGVSWRTIGVRSVVYALVFNIPYISAAVVFGLGAATDVLPGKAPTLATLAPLGVIAATIVLVALIAALARSRWMSGAARWKHNVHAVLAVVPDGVRELPRYLRRPALVAGAFGYWTFDCAVLWATFHACGGSPAVGVVVLAYMLGQLGNALPLPGGIGGVEPLMLGIFVASGVDAGLAAAAIVCYRAIALGMQSIAGVVSISSLVPAVRRERRH
jgi:uncharacterized membrane protein YbhN (UPF0104 family)